MMSLGVYLLSLKNYCVLTFVVVSESSLITGGHAISKVRVMDEENEVRGITCKTCFNAMHC